MISGKLIGRYLPARPSFLGGRVTLHHPADPENDGSEEWLENEGEDVICMLPWWKWAMDKASQYQREERANWPVLSPFGSAYIAFGPLLYISIRL